MDKGSNVEGIEAVVGRRHRRRWHVRVRYAVGVTTTGSGDTLAEAMDAAARPSC